MSEFEDHVQEHQAIGIEKLGNEYWSEAGPVSWHNMSSELLLAVSCCLFSALKSQLTLLGPGSAYPAFQELP